MLSLSADPFSIVAFAIGVRRAGRTRLRIAGSLIILLVAVAIGSGLTTVVLLWPVDQMLAMIVAPFVSSFAVAMTAVLLARHRESNDKASSAPRQALFEAWQRLKSR